MDELLSAKSAHEIPGAAVLDESPSQSRSDDRTADEPDSETKKLSDSAAKLDELLAEAGKPGARKPGAGSARVPAAPAAAMPPAAHEARAAGKERAFVDEATRRRAFDRALEVAWKAFVEELRRGGGGEAPPRDP